MYFHTWLKKNRIYNSEYVTREKVMTYLKGKEHPKAKAILKECKADPSVMFIPIDVWEDKYYNFKAGSK
jgi:hypothetical protein